eukprot:SAG31_NODE_5199_length_2681_cov_4.603408_2_plen_80_part_00
MRRENLSKGGKNQSILVSLVFEKTGSTIVFFGGVGFEREKTKANYFAVSRYLHVCTAGRTGISLFLKINVFENVFDTRS